MATWQVPGSTPGTADVVLDVEHRVLRRPRRRRLWIRRRVHGLMQRARRVIAAVSCGGRCEEGCAAGINLLAPVALATPPCICIFKSRRVDIVDSGRRTMEWGKGNNNRGKRTVTPIARAGGTRSEEAHVECTRASRETSTTLCCPAHHTAVVLPCSRSVLPAVVRKSVMRRQSRRRQNACSTSRGRDGCGVSLCSTSRCCGQERALERR